MNYLSVANPAGNSIPGIGPGASECGAEIGPGALTDPDVSAEGASGSSRRRFAVTLTMLGLAVPGPAVRCPSPRAPTRDGPAQALARSREPLGRDVGRPAIRECHPHGSDLPAPLAVDDEHPVVVNRQPIEVADAQVARSLLPQ